MLCDVLFFLCYVVQMICLVEKCHFAIFLKVMERFKLDLKLDYKYFQFLPRNTESTVYLSKATAKKKIFNIFILKVPKSDRNAYMSV